MQQDNIAIIGSGISGIATAHELQKLGFNVDIFEKDSFIGGRVAPMEIDGSPITIGGENIGQNYKEFRKFCMDIGIENFKKYGLNITTVSRKKDININKNYMIKTFINILRIISFNDIKKIRVMVHSIKKDENNAFLSGDFFKKYQNKTVASFFSEEYLDYILRSLLVINNAAEVDEIFLETFGTNLAMLLDNYEHIEGGSYKLFDNFSKNSNIFLEKNITSLWYQDKELKGVIVDNKEKLKYDAVVLATTATSASKLLEKNNKKLSDNLKKVRYFPVAMLVAKYEKDVFTNKLNGYIFPKKSILSNVGVYDLEKKNYVRYTFSGREARSVLNNNLSIEELIVLAEKEFTKHCSIELPKRIDVGGRVTEQSAYSLNHQEFLEDVRLNLIDSKNIYLAGDYLESTSIEGCYRSGVAVSKQVLKKFESRRESENSNSETRKSII